MSIREDILTMKPIEKIHLVDQLLLSLNQPDEDLDRLWAKEVQSRIEAYEKGVLKAVPKDEVFSKYHK